MWVVSTDSWHQPQKVQPHVWPVLSTSTRNVCGSCLYGPQNGTAMRAAGDLEGNGKVTSSTPSGCLQVPAREPEVAHSAGSVGTVRGVYLALYKSTVLGRAVQECAASLLGRLRGVIEPVSR